MVTALAILFKRNFLGVHFFRANFYLIFVLCLDGSSAVSPWWSRSTKLEVLDKNLAERYSGGSPTVIVSKYTYNKLVIEIWIWCAIEKLFECTLFLFFLVSVFAFHYCENVMTCQRKGIMGRPLELFEIGNQQDWRGIILKENITKI